jgi:nucleotide-binding universal stress UspA family protein
MAIVVGVDGSNESMEALRWALGEARLRGTGVRAVRVWEYPFVAPSAEWTLGAPTPKPLAVDPQQVRRLAETQLAQAVSDVEPDAAAVRIEQHVIEGHPARALVEASKGADLLVVGSRGHGGFGGLLLGSVSQACVHHARCPVVVVRPRKATAA